MIIFIIFAVMKRLASYLNNLMNESGLDQRDLALQCCMPYQNVSAILSGKREPSIKQSIMLDDIFGLEKGTINRILFEEEKQKHKDLLFPSSLKHEILIKVKKNGGLWSYSGIPNSLSDDDIIEEALRHLDFEDMEIVFRLWSFSHIKRVWKQRLVSEGKRSNILNTMLGIMFFRISSEDIDNYLKRYSYAKY